MTAALLRNALSPSERELFDLNYLDPTDVGRFGRNFVADLFATEEPDAGRALVTTYIAPTEPIELRPTQLFSRIADSGLRSYPPAAAETGELVPSLCRPISHGVLAHDGNRDLTTLTTAFVLRTTASVELIDGDATSAERGSESWLNLRFVLVRTAQLLNYIARFAEQIERDEWVLLLNVRDASRASLLGEHPSWERYRAIPVRPLERHLQFRIALRPEDEEQRRRTVLHLDELLSFAFGRSEPRGHDQSGRLVNE